LGAWPVSTAGANRSICATLGAHTLLHVACEPLVLSLLAGAGANSAAMEGLAREVALTLEPVRSAIATHETQLQM
jgi:hypothetical protein